ncbi:DUF1622 domain-containing protein [Halopseudomonas pelagia]|uniref:DUF1622 domain-containing protein n=1 Tax=Halopseudomonas pelagia TaxID=553151 RepID=UPI0003A3F8D1|nr:DUF1622 domain-containing protein [Halopseudomonas pelagia]
MGDWVIEVTEWTVAITELLGLGVIALTALYSIVIAGVHAIQGYNAERVFREVRQRLGRGILLGLEFLIAADIIFTVAIDLTFESVGVLALIVLVRTFLSFTLEVELTGSWPWQRKSHAKSEQD